MITKTTASMGLLTAYLHQSTFSKDSSCALLISSLREATCGLILTSLFNFPSTLGSFLR